MSDFNKLATTTQDVYLIDFWAEWCGPCKAMNPVLDRLSQDADLVASGVVFSKVNTEEEEQLTMQFGITGIPCFKVIKFDAQGGFKVLGEFIGVQSDPLKFKMRILELVNSFKGTTEAQV